MAALHIKAFTGELHWITAGIGRNPTVQTQYFTKTYIIQRISVCNIARLCYLAGLS